ncbi:PEP-CTERM/exosortase system-associated acyltransferase [Salinicola peritrichatus]|uniref:PEP-CTERM/exosortase system-associated acyltransferase n=1 Tax=Salinicola peritrichatus TaxID=1267424 RepID=UPI000DA16314|nr:PEP-CTERM/exosortase system-associated acyltransferase [Salinicola peritrichatus]
MIDEFLDRFQVILATTADEKDRVFSLRHQVYCEELGYEPLNLKDRIERDEFDTRSLHCLIEHRSTGLAAGCMRVVIPDASSAKFSQLPIEEHCRQFDAVVEWGRRSIDRNSLCEISRIAIPRYFRTQMHKQRESAVTGLGELVFTKQERRVFPLIGVSLFLCATALTGIAQRHHVLAMMENRFYRLLARTGLKFEQVSRPMQFRGQRAAFYIDQRNAENELRESVRQLYAVIKEDLTVQYALEVSSLHHLIGRPVCSPY